VMGEEFHLSEDAVILDKSPLGIPVPSILDDDPSDIILRGESGKVSLKKMGDKGYCSCKLRSHKRSIINCSELPAGIGEGRIEEGIPRDWADPIPIQSELAAEIDVSLSGNF